jgi:hypothetical protein
MMRYLVVANQTAAGPTLKRTIRSIMDQGPCRFTLLVPTTHPRHQATWTEGSAMEVARRHMDAALASLQETGADIEGVVGDANPYTAICDALSEQRYDGVVISTFPPGVSRWIRMDLESRVRSRFDIPVRMVFSEKVTVEASA